MARSKEGFIGSYVAVFLGAVAAQRYLQNSDPTWKWTSTQPVEDAHYCAEKAWDSLQQLQQRSTSGTTGSVATAATGTDSTPTT